MRWCACAVVLGSVGGAWGAPPDAGAELAAQAELFRRAERAAPADEAVELFAKALAAEGALFAGPTHAGLLLREHLHRRYAERTGPKPDAPRRDPAAAREAVREAVAAQTRLLQAPSFTKAEAEARAARLTAAVAARARAVGEKHPLVGLTLIDLALAEEAAGRADAARAALGRADRLLPARGHVGALYLSDAKYHLDRLRGEPPARPAAFADRLDRASAAATRAAEREAADDVPGARAAWGGAVGGFQAFIGSGFAAAESEQLAMAREFRAALSGALAFAARHGLSDADAAQWYRGASHIKGGAFTHQYRLRRERHHAVLAPLFATRADLCRRLATLLAAPVEPPNADEVKRLQVLKACVETETARRYDALPWMWNPPPMPRGAALLDYYVYEAPVPGKPAERRLACFVRRSEQSHPKAPVVHRDLGPLAPVEEAVRRWRDDLAAKGGTAPAAELRKLVLEPVAPLLDGASVVLVSPDGALAAVPFAALPGAKPGTYLLEEVAVAVVPVPQLFAPLPSQTAFLARRDGIPAVPPAEPAAPLLVGGADFSAGAAPRRQQNAFRALPGTRREVDELAELFRGTSAVEGQVLTGAGATEAAVGARAGDCKWLHVASHGYFAPRPAAGADVPELRAALVLAGANRAPGPTDDGLLTALEIAALDLGGVELAVLSACETGLGAADDGEGVHGLQRAFQLAGARTTVTSLWEVDDEATRALMVRFYWGLWADRRRPLEALREAQLWMLREGRAHAGVARGLRKAGAAPPSAGCRRTTGPRSCSRATGAEQLKWAGDDPTATIVIPSETVVRPLVSGLLRGRSSHLRGAHEVVSPDGRRRGAGRCRGRGVGGRRVPLAAPGAGPG